MLYRKDKNNVCVYSSVPLDQGKLLCRNYIVQNVIEIDNIYNKIKSGDVIKVFLRTSPSKKIIVSGKKNSKRRTLLKKEERLAWLEHKLSESGAEVVTDLFGQKLIQENGKTEIKFAHFENQLNQGAHTICAYDYIVSVRVNSVDSFLQSVANGIGPYKSYGCGLLLIGA